MKPYLPADFKKSSLLHKYYVNRDEQPIRPSWEPCPFTTDKALQRRDTIKDRRKTYGKRLWWRTGLGSWMFTFLPHNQMHKSATIQNRMNG